LIHNFAVTILFIIQGILSIAAMAKWSPEEGVPGLTVVVNAIVRVCSSAVVKPFIISQIKTAADRPFMIRPVRPAVIKKSFTAQLNSIAVMGKLNPVEEPGLIVTVNVIMLIASRVVLMRGIINQYTKDHAVVV
jgi:uncharacterized membrane protein required for colicin V production